MTSRTTTGLAVLAVLTALAAGTFVAPAQAADGALDTTFDIDGKVTTAIGATHDEAHSIAVQPDGRIVAGGYSIASDGTHDFALARYNSDGAIDTTFGGDGKVTTAIGALGDVVQSIAIQSDGKIVAGGYSSSGASFDFALARYNSDGSPDTGFGTAGTVTTAFASGKDDAVESIAIQSDGKIVAAGNSRSLTGVLSQTQADFALARYTANGVLDTTFGSAGDGMVTTPILAGDDLARSIVLQTGGKIVAGGTAYNGSNHDFALARYTAEGVLDPTFGVSGKVTTPIGSSDDGAFSIQISDGRLVAGGYSSNGSDDDFALARYTPDGVLDTPFGGGDGKVTTAIGASRDEVQSIAIQSDGKIVAGGYSEKADFNYEFALARYTADGSLDITFDGDGKVTTAIGNFDEVEAVAIQSNGRLVVGGWSDTDPSIGSNFDFALARYDSGASSHVLSVTKGGAGSGTLTSAPAGIDCGATCSASFNGGTSVTLTATPAVGSVFAGWSGACTGVTTTQCTLTMNLTKSAGVTFNVTPPTPAPTTTPAPVPTATTEPPVIRPAAALSKGCIKTGKYYGFVKGVFNNSASNRAFTYVLKTRVVLTDGSAKVLTYKVTVPAGEKASKRLRYLKSVQTVRARITNLTGSRVFDRDVVRPSSCR